MPELPDVTVYLEALDRHVMGRPLAGVRLASPFLLRSVQPPLAAFEGRVLTQLRRIGKRLAFGFSGTPADAPGPWLVLHLMIAGRLHWKPGDAAIPGGKRGLAAFDFGPRPCGSDRGTLILTEAGTKKRASLHAVADAAGLAAHDPGGLEVLACDGAAFAERLRQGNHTVKRALTDPRLFSGIGNAYSDEILHRARLSPIARTASLTDAQVTGLFTATCETLEHWIELLRADAGDGFPAKVTAFRLEMAVHGKFDQPCPDCGTRVQRIVHASNETNYCPRCQTDGKVLADRNLSRLLKADWPRSIEELEAMGVKRG